MESEHLVKQKVFLRTCCVRTRAEKRTMHQDQAKQETNTLKLQVSYKASQV
jgi:hypothetical protein